MAGVTPKPINSPAREPTSGPTEEWVVIVEFGAARDRPPLSVQEVEALICQLRDWNAAGLWSPDRYALQLRIPARSHAQALGWALAHHGEACRAASLPAATFIRAEVLTPDELENAIAEAERAEGVDAVPVQRSVLCDEMLIATRRLIRAGSEEEISGIVNAFVTTMGGRVERGPARHVPGRIDCDVSIDADVHYQASAVAFSVAGLIIEQSLETLVLDARHAATRLRSKGWSTSWKDGAIRS